MLTKHFSPYKQVS